MSENDIHTATHIHSGPLESGGLCVFEVNYGSFRFRWERERDQKECFMDGARGIRSVCVRLYPCVRVILHILNVGYFIKPTWMI